MVDSTALALSQPLCCSDLLQKSESLTTTLKTVRSYLDQTVSSLRVQDSTAFEGVAEDTPVFDPRFLVFEFTWNIVMRPSQVSR